MTKYLTRHNCLSYILFNNILTSTLMNSKSNRTTYEARPCHEVRVAKIESNFETASVHSEEDTPSLSRSSLRCHQEWVMHIALCISQTDHCSQKLSHFSLIEAYEYPRTRATNARHDGSSRTDNAGRRWRPRPAERGRKWPRTGRVARECITCDDRRSRN